MKRAWPFFGALCVFLLGCQGSAAANPFLQDAYWDAGKAEFQVYTGTVRKYGMDRRANVKLILVKEPFDPVRGVKAGKAEGTVSVIKMNHIRWFNTGIYDYTQMASLFFDRATGRVLKLAMSSQDGCGTTFREYLYRDGKPIVRTFSYFDDQGDTVSILENGDFTFYDALPVVLRFRLDEPGPYRLRVMDSLISNQAVPLTIRESVVRNRSERNRKVGGKTYPGVFVTEVDREGRKDRFVFGGAFPHRLLSWRQAGGHELTLDQSHFLYYWNYVKPQDRVLGEVRRGAAR